MSYYSYNYHQPYLGEGYQNPYSGNYDIVPSEALMDYSSHEFNHQNFFQYNPVSYCGAYAYDPPMNRSVTAYSAYTFSEPKSIVYDPYGVDYSLDVTQFRISYSVSEFNDTEFEEYDPTPYGGGYDIDLTYGKPLSPSEEICYPHSLPDSPALPPKESVEEPAVKPHIESRPTPTKEAEPQVHTSTGDARNKEDESTRDGSPEKPSGIIKVEDGQQNDSDEDNSYEYYKRGPHVPSGYGLEAVDLCESLFGYWPCLAKYNKGGRDCAEVSKEDITSKLWKDTADYLFGSSYPYGERRDGISSVGDPMYGYDCERHYQGQSVHRQFHYDEDSWMLKFKNF